MFNRLTINRRHCCDPDLGLFYPCFLVQPWQAGSFRASIAWPVALACVDRSAELARAVASVNVAAFVLGALAQFSPSAAPVHPVAFVQRRGTWLGSVAGSAESRLHAAGNGSPGSGSRIVVSSCAGSVPRSTVVGRPATVPPPGPSYGSTCPIRCVATTSFAPSDRPNAAPHRRSSHG